MEPDRSLRSQAFRHPYSVAAFIVLGLVLLSLIALTAAAATTQFAPWYYFAIPLAAVAALTALFVLTTPRRFRRSKPGRSN